MIISPLRGLVGRDVFLFYNNSIPSGLKIQNEGNERKREGIVPEYPVIREE